LTPAIEARIPEKLRNEKFTYVEPFFGGGAMFFWLKNNFNIEHAVINDVNSDLVNCYQVVQTQVNNLIDVLHDYQEEYRKVSGNKEAKAKLFYDVRTTFNSKTGGDIERAAQLIFLNKTCFNGLYRVNSKDKFNVPIGSYKNPTICDPDNLLRVSKVFQNTTILNGDYTETLKHVNTNKNCLFYFDPPYKPINATSSFNAYAKGGFNDDEQVRLSQFCRQLDEKKISWILSNSDVDHPESPNKFFDDLYEGFDIRRVQASRAINSVSSKRGKLNELLISNNLHSNQLV